MNADIVLTGLPGAGKTTVGKLLSENIKGYRFCDVDSLIEAREKMTISEIFEKKSENYFRKLEESLIKELSSQKGLIISIGGGAFESEINRTNLLNCGTVFYLYAPAEVLYERIKHQKNRPLLNCDNPFQKLSELLLKREINCKKSHFTIDTTDKTPDETARDILRTLK